MSSRERDVDGSTRDDPATSSEVSGRTRTIDRARPADASGNGHTNGDDDSSAVDLGAEELSTELVPSIDPLLPPLPRVQGNGDATTTTHDEPALITHDEPEASLAADVDERPDADVRSRRVDAPVALVAEPIPEARAPLTAPPPPAVTRVAPAVDDVSAPIPIITRRATVVGAERHLVAPVHRAIGRRPRVRKVTRVVRHVDPWTVFKVAAVFSAVVYGVLLTAGVLLWNVASTTGTVDNVERFFESFGWTEFELNGGQIYHSAWIAGLFGAVALTGFAVLGATLFNLITDLVGGLRFTVLEEEVVEKTASPMRRFTVRRTETDPTPYDGEPRPAADIDP